MNTPKTISWQFFDASGNEHRCTLAACQCQSGIPVMTGRDLVTFQWRFNVRCPQCGKEGDASPSPQQAVANWNAERGIRELDLKPGKEVSVSHPARAGKTFASREEENRRIAADLLEALREMILHAKWLNYNGSEPIFQLSTLQKAERAMKAALGAQEPQTTNEEKGTK